MERRGSCGEDIVIEDEIKAFIGMKGLVAKQRSTVKKFISWSNSSLWSKFHSSCYDWYAFPIPEKSQHGSQWTLSSNAIQELMKNEQFIKRFRTGVTLLMTSYGWEISNNKMIPRRRRNEAQKWNKRPIRLYKCGLSCLILGQIDLYEKVKKFALYLEKKKENLVFGRVKGCKINVMKRWELYERYLNDKE